MDSAVQQIKDRLSINEVVGQYVQLKRAGRNYTARCPFHKERTPSFYVSPERGTYMCFGCGEKGDIFSFIQKIEGVDFSGALKQLAQKAGVKLDKRFVRPQKDVEKGARLLQACEAATAFFEAELSKKQDARNYLKTRGIEEETILSWRLGYAPATWESLTQHLLSFGFTKEEIVGAGLGVKSEKKPGEIFDRFRGRIMFPIFDSGGEVIAFSGRFFEKVPGQKDPPAGGEPAKYINSPETELFKKSRTLYGYDRARSAIRKLDCILLVEGQFDVVLAHQSGLPFAVALSGTALTPEHLTRLNRLSKRLVLALDADAAGIRSGLKSAHMALNAGFDVKIPTFPPGKDPADLARENPELLKAAVRTSVTAVEFFLNALWPTAKDERSYKKIVEGQVLPLVRAIGSRIDQAHFIQIIAARLHIPEIAVQEEVWKLPAPGGGEETSSEVHLKAGELPLTPLQKKAGMLLFYFEKDEAMQERLKELLGAERVAELVEELLPSAEILRFNFESEVGEHAKQPDIAGDLLKQLEIMTIEEQMAAARGDAQRMTELARRKHELQK